MSNSIPNKTPKYYIFEDTSENKGYGYGVDDVKVKKAIGSRIQTVNVNGKKKQAVIFLYQKKKRKILLRQSKNLKKILHLQPSTSKIF